MWVKMAALLSTAAILAGCAQEDQSAAPASATMPPLSVGLLGPFSGEASGYGVTYQRVAQIAAKKINDAGGVGGRMIQFEVEDGGCNADQTNKAINSLVSIKKVKVIIGGFCSSETLTSAPVVEQNKVVLLSPGSSNPDITKAGEYIFRNYPSDLAQGGALAELAKNKGYKKVGVLTEEQPYTEGIADAFSGSFSKSGGQTVVEKFTTDASDFRTQITKLQAAKVDLFFVNSQTPVKGALIVKQLQEAGIKGPLFINDATIGGVKEVVEKYKEYLEGSFGAEVSYDKNNSEMQNLFTTYKAEHGEDMQHPSYMATTYDAVHIIKEAVEKVGEDGAKIKDYLYTVKGRKGLAGTLSFDQNGDPDESFRHSLRVIQNGAVVEYKE